MEGPYQWGTLKDGRRIFLNPQVGYWQNYPDGSPAFPTHTSSPAPPYQASTPEQRPRYTGADHSFTGNFSNSYSDSENNSQYTYGNLSQSFSGLSVSDSSNAYGGQGQPSYGNPSNFPQQATAGFPSTGYGGQYNQFHNQHSGTAGQPYSPSTIGYGAYQEPYAGYSGGSGQNPGTNSGYGSGQAYGPSNPTPSSRGKAYASMDKAPAKRNIQSGPAKKITDRDLFDAGIQAHMKIKQTSGTYEKLDPAYKKRHPSFFKRGRVFKILWPELASDHINDGVTICSEPRFAENIAVKFRWFVIIRQGNKSCSCLLIEIQRPIQTYGGRGVANPSVIKSHHAIIYSTETPPEPTAGEAPTGSDPGLGQAIRVVPKSPTMKLDRMSRVNFFKIYTVEHNVKVFHFGDVHPDWEVWLVHQFQQAWLSTPVQLPINTQPTARTQAIPVTTEEEEEDEEEDESDEEDEDEDEDEDDEGDESDDTEEE